MVVSPASIEVGGEVLPAEDIDEDEDGDLCRICRSPEEPDNPLRYPCLCRGSIKYVHEDCLRIWLNRRDYKKCEICGCSYSFVPLYSENAPERLSCHEFLKGVLVRGSPYVRMIVSWVLVFLLNAFCFSLHPLGKRVAADFQRVFGVSSKFASLLAGLFYNVMLVDSLTLITVIRAEVIYRNARRIIDEFRAGISNGDGLRQGAFGGFMQGLWKYMKILCNWYLIELLYFVRRARRRINNPRNVSLHEFEAIRRLLFFLDDSAFVALAISMYVSFFFVLLPFLIGWTVIATVGGSYLSTNSPVILGYTVMLSMSCACFGILFTLSQNSFQAIVQWCLLGIHFITVRLPCLLWNFSVKVCKNLSVIKDAFVVCFKIGVLPWIVGRWLEICTSALFDTTNSPIFAMLTRFPLLVLIPWISGFFCLTNAALNMDFIQKIIHRRAFWYLIDITDPDYKITKLNLGYTFLAIASHGVLLVILFHLPMKAITLISPSFCPLKLWIADEYPLIAFGIYMNLINYGFPWLIKHTQPASELIIHNWIVTVSSWFQLSDFLLVVPRGEVFHRADQNGRPLMQPRRELGDNPWFILYSIAEGSMVILHKSQNAENDMEVQTKNRFLLRIALMLVLAALSLFLFSTVFMALPVSVGRVFFDSISFIMLRFGVKHDDFCAFWTGCCILRAIYISACFIFDHIQRGRIDLLLRYVITRIRNCLFFSIWISVIPGLLGVLIDLMIIIPSGVLLNEPLVNFLIRDWLIGVVVLHIWTFLTMLTPINWFATEAWRRKLKRIRNVGISRLPTMWLFKDVIGSIITALLTTLSIPYLLVKSLLPLLRFSHSINSAVERLIWPALLALITVWFMVKLTRDLIIYLHQLVFNERYVVGERVDNLTEHLEYGV